jgi:hypothetical protein
MSGESSPGPSASDIAEQVLQRIYGDDFAGCNVDPNEIASIIEAALKTHKQRTTDLLDLYDKVVEAIELLSTPPEPGRVTEKRELATILSERLDAIRTVTTKTRETVAKFKAAAAEG